MPPASSARKHLGDRTNTCRRHGFDEFFGNLYHLNAEEEPERPNYPRMTRSSLSQLSARGASLQATDRDDPTVDPAYGKGRKQTIEDTARLTRSAMETIDDETTDAAIDFIKRQSQANRRSSAGSTRRACTCSRMVRPSMRGQSGFPDNEYADGMIEHDGGCRQSSQGGDDLNIANDTIVIYSTDNGPNMFTCRTRR